MRRDETIDWARLRSKTATYSTYVIEHRILRILVFKYIHLSNTYLQTKHPKSFSLRPPSTTTCRHDNHPIMRLH